MWTEIEVKRNNTKELSTNAFRFYVNWRNARENSIENDDLAKYVKNDK